MRLTFLIAHLIEIMAVSEDWGDLKSAPADDPIKMWSEEREKKLREGQGRVTKANPFQDDVNIYTVGHRASDRATRGDHNLLVGKLRLLLSEKPETNRPFDSCFGSLGA